jgi:hypothetical protein
MAFAPVENRLAVANGGSGSVKTLDATSFQTLQSIDNLPALPTARTHFQWTLVGRLAS